jgi:transposase-like protein
MGRTKGPRKISRYTAEFKVKAVKLSEISGVQVRDVADALDIHPFMLSRWRKEYREGRLRARVGVSPGLRQVREVRELSSLQARVRAAAGGARALKKSHPVLFRTTGAIFAFIKAEQDRFGVRALCRRYGVTRGGYYAWCSRKLSERALEDDVLRVRIGSVLEASEGTYGSPRIHEALRRAGVRGGVSEWRG